MTKVERPITFGMALTLAAGLVIVGWQAVQGQQPPTIPAAKRAPAPPNDPAAEAQVARKVAADRPELRLSEHDRSGIFDPAKIPASSPALDSQVEKGRF